MGNSKPVAEPKKRKKKGRPSLLDLQKRNLRLQKLEQQNTNQKHQHRNPNPSPTRNPTVRSPPSSAVALRRSARRNPEVAAAAAEDDDDDDEEEEEEREEGSVGRRKEKKLRLVLRLPNSRKDDLDSSGSDSDARRKRRIDAVGKTERQNSTLKATDPLQESSHSGPTTALPDKKLLEFILDRLQKKDTYGVFTEPVDPDELPDYHEIIEHPMDFSTIRKKLAGGAYANLEQFEKDVFLISSNAMRYNSPDTIYYRQARAIQEIAKKDFDNLRQESDDNEPEPKPVRRGRPPTKNILKKLGRPPVERAGSDFSSSATLANAGDKSHLSHDLSRKGLDKPSLEASVRPYSLRTIEAHSWGGECKSERNDEYSGSALKGTRYGKKLSVVDENRRTTYNQSCNSSSIHEAPVLTALDRERKQLVPVGLLMEHAYARSLARFAANLGPIGWEIAAKRIERVLAPGTQFGRGWVGEKDMPRSSQPILSSSPPPSPKPKSIVPSTTGASVAEQRSSNEVFEVRASITHASPVTSSVTPSGTIGSMKGTEIMGSHESGFIPRSVESGHGIWPRTPFQLRQNPSVQPTLNGFNHQLVFNQPYQDGNGIPSKPPESSGVEATITHSRALDLVSRASNYINNAPKSHFIMDKVKPVADQSVSSTNNHSHDSHGAWRGLSLSSKIGPVPPDLNVGLQSPGSPTSGLLVDPQHSDLALQL